MLAGTKVNFCILHNCVRRQSHCVHTNTQVWIFLKSGNKAETPVKKISLLQHTWLCELAGAKPQGSPRADPPEQHCQLYICLWHLIGAALPETLPPIFPFQVDPLWEQTLHLARCTICSFFCVCLMILDQPFSLGSACIASPPPFYKCCHHPLSTWHWIEEPPRTRLWGAGAYWDVQATLNEKKIKGKTAKKLDQRKLVSRNSAKFTTCGIIFH